MTSKKHFLVCLILIFALGSILLFLGCNSPQVKLLRENSSPTIDIPVAINTIRIKNGQFEPKIIQVFLGQRVTFENLDKDVHTVASDPHPAHSDLPDFYSPPIYQGEKYQFTFDLYGAWGFHLEDNPSVSGKVIAK